MTFSSGPLPKALQDRLDRVRQLNCSRSLSFRQGIDFSSNDYLGFADDPLLKERIEKEKTLALGSTGSRLLNGNLPFFEETENLLAHFCGREAALVYSSGYQANLGLLSALLKREDFVFSDENNHASLIDGVRLSGAQKRIFFHQNLSHLRELLEAESQSPGLKVIVTESVFSMDGDFAPLTELADLAEEFNALLIVDEAHATGLWGKLAENQGGGRVQALGLEGRVFATIHPGGKAMGVGGAWVCGSFALKNYLVNFSRPFIFSTAPIPHLFLSLRSSIDFWKEVGRNRAQIVLENVSRFQKALQFQKTLSPSAIVPILIGDNQRAFDLAQRLQDQGWDVRAIRPPTVPKGTARLRVTLKWIHSWELLEKFSDVLNAQLTEKLQQFPASPGIPHNAARSCVTRPKLLENL